MNTQAETSASPGASWAPASGASDELRQSPVAPLLVVIYRRLRGPGSASVRRMIVRALSALEGGPMRSASMRRLMSEVHGVSVGAHSYGCFDPVRFPPGIEVGRYVSIGPNVTAYRRNHPLDRLSLHPYFYRPALGANADADVATAGLEIAAGAWLGASALVLPGCRRIGRGAVVAAGAVLTKDVPDYAVVGGSPARLIRYRFDPEGIASAEATRWWLYEPADVAARHDISGVWAESRSAAVKDAIRA